MTSCRGVAGGAAGGEVSAPSIRPGRLTAVSAARPAARGVVALIVVPSVVLWARALVQDGLGNPLTLVRDRHRFSRPPVWVWREAAARCGRSQARRCAPLPEARRADRGRPRRS